MGCTSPWGAKRRGGSREEAPRAGQRDGERRPGGRAGRTDTDRPGGCRSRSHRTGGPGAQVCPHLSTSPPPNTPPSLSERKALPRNAKGLEDSRRHCRVRVSPTASPDGGTRSRGTKRALCATPRLRLQTRRKVRVCPGRVDGLGVQEETGSTSLLRRSISGDSRGKGTADFQGGGCREREGAARGLPVGAARAKPRRREGSPGTVSVSRDRTEATVGSGVLKRKPLRRLVISWVFYSRNSEWTGVKNRK